MSDVEAACAGQMKQFSCPIVVQIEMYFKTGFCSHFARLSVTRDVFIKITFLRRIFGLGWQARSQLFLLESES